MHGSGALALLRQAHIIKQICIAASPSLNRTGINTCPLPAAREAEHTRSVPRPPSRVFTRFFFVMRAGTVFVSSHGYIHNMCRRRLFLRHLSVAPGHSDLLTAPQADGHTCLLVISCTSDRGPFASSVAGVCICVLCQGSCVCTCTHACLGCWQRKDCTCLKSFALATSSLHAWSWGNRVMLLVAVMHMEP